jgi:tRNA/tmRNA/rRNA uracil-C5-methylase (TrmA/RlmC/RlmD family)
MQAEDRVMLTRQAFIVSDSERLVEEYELPRQKDVVVVNPARIGVDLWMLWV